MHADCGDCEADADASYGDDDERGFAGDVDCGEDAEGDGEGGAGGAAPLAGSGPMPVSWATQEVATGGRAGVVCGGSALSGNVRARVGKSK